MKRGRRVHYGKRFHVSAYVPSRLLAEAAQERVEGLVGFFLSCAPKDDVREWINDLEMLARSCYLQGATDAALVAAEMRLKEKSGAG